MATESAKRLSSKKTGFVFLRRSFKFPVSVVEVEEGGLSGREGPYLSFSPLLSSLFGGRE